MVDCGSKDVWELLPRGIYVKWLRLFFFLYWTRIVPVCYNEYKIMPDHLSMGRAAASQGRRTRNTWSTVAYFNKNWGFHFKQKSFES
jgi:hypothetical protein